LLFFVLENVFLDHINSILFHGHYHHIQRCCRQCECW